MKISVLYAHILSGYLTLISISHSSTDSINRYDNIFLLIPPHLYMFFLLFYVFLYYFFTAEFISFIYFQYFFCIFMFYSLLLKINAYFIFFLLCIFGMAHAFFRIIHFSFPCYNTIIKKQMQKGALLK